jgi:hypothetical protein
MTPELETLLVAETSRLGAHPVDPEIFKALNVPENLDASDSTTLTKVAQALIVEHPALFTIEKGWDEITDPLASLCLRILDDNAVLRVSVPLP